MKEKEILKNNSMIAEFMGGKEVDWFSERVIIMPYSKDLTIKNYITKSKAYILDTEIKFHSSWDWLIPVIKKCWSIKSPTNEGWSKANRIEERVTPCNIWNDNIIGVYCEVVEFINWYNESKPKQRK